MIQMATTHIVLLFVEFLKKKLIFETLRLWWKLQKSKFQVFIFIFMDLLILKDLACS